MQKQFDKVKNAIVVHLSGEIDQCVANEIKDRIDIEILNSKKRNVIIDLNDVTLMDSSGIGLIVGRFKTARSVGGTLLLSGGSSSVKKMIDLSGIGKVIDMYDSVREADNTLNKNERERIL